MELRPARHDDARWIGAYHRRCWTLGYAGLVDDEVLEALRVEDHIARWDAVLRSEQCVPVVAVVDGRPVGHVRVDGDTITNVYVDPDHWGRGVGRTLLGEGEAMLSTAGHTRGVLWTIVGNERAVALYESAGWSGDGTVEVHRSSTGVPVREQRMTKLLAGEVDTRMA